jgi:hypothetical protein
MADRHGNPYFTDEQQVEWLLFAMKSQAIWGFSGTDKELGLRAEAWWYGDWPDDRCPSLEEAREFLAERKQQVA